MSCQTKVFKMVTKAEPSLKVIYFATFKVDRHKWRNQQKRPSGLCTLLWHAGQSHFLIITKLLHQLIYVTANKDIYLVMVHVSLYLNRSIQNINTKKNIFFGYYQLLSSFLKVFRKRQLEFFQRKFKKKKINPTQKLSK